MNTEDSKKSMSTDSQSAREQITAIAVLEKLALILERALKKSKLRDRVPTDGTAQNLQVFEGSYFLAETSLCRSSPDQRVVSAILQFRIEPSTLRLLPAIRKAPTHFSPDGEYETRILLELHLGNERDVMIVETVGSGIIIDEAQLAARLDSLSVKFIA